MTDSLLQERFRNQSGIIDVCLYSYLDIAIVGNGSIGSFLALALNKLGFENLVLVDPDIVEEHNVATQLYGDLDIGKHKSLILKNHLYGNISSYPGKVSATNKINTDVVFVCVDSLEARKDIYQSIRTNYATNGIPKLLIDGRMFRLLFEVYTVVLTNPNSVKEYEKTLHYQEFGGNCTEKGIIQNVFAVVSVMIEQFKKILNGETYKEVINSDFERYKFIQTDFQKEK